MRICKVDGCDNKYYIKGYCVRHCMQIKRNGRILKKTNRDKNEIRLGRKYVYISLYNVKQEKIKEAIIDKEDLCKVNKIKWCSQRGYVYNWKHGYLHNLIMNHKGIDHINGNPLDNRKENLRKATQSQNTQNKKCRGYHWSKKDKSWRVLIGENYKKHYIGSFKTEKEAKKARKSAELKYYGEFSRHNK